MNQIIKLIEKVLSLMSKIVSQLAVSIFCDNVKRHQILKLFKKITAYIDLWRKNDTDI